MRKKDVKHWSPRHDEMVRLYMAGYTRVEICAAIGISKRGLAAVLNSPTGVKRIAWFRDEMDKAIINAAAIHQGLAIMKEVQRGLE